MFFYFYQVLSVVWWLETLNTLGYVLALEKVSYQLISPTYLFRGLSSALMSWFHFQNSFILFKEDKYQNKLLYVTCRFLEKN